MRPHLGITMGDPAGIGPEIIVKACAKLHPRLEAGELGLLVIGSNAALKAARAQLGADVEIPEVSAEEAWPALACLQAGPETDPIKPGVLSAAGGRMAYLAIERGVRLAEAGRLQGIVTAPLNKEALNKAGYHYAGHTEMLADLTGVRSSVMMLAHDNMRVSHVSTHVALEDVPKRLTPERLRTVIDLTHDALRDLGVVRARIAVAALNPHAGEGGLFGRQDIDISGPTIARCVADGLDVVGPVPGDTVFVKLRAGDYDAVIAMYHDQGHIPVKLLGFSVDPETGRWNALSGVNITLGLPIIRTSVDHGTAFDIAGKGIASEMSLIEAVEYAERLAAARLGRAEAGTNDRSLRPAGAIPS
jgi:4-hydroxythreonine-4-phosphate dehydrogenase